MFLLHMCGGLVHLQVQYAWREDLMEDFLFCLSPNVWGYFSPNLACRLLRAATHPSLTLLVRVSQGHHNKLTLQKFKKWKWVWESVLWISNTGCRQLLLTAAFMSLFMDWFHIILNFILFETVRGNIRSICSVLWLLVSVNILFPF